MKKISFTLDCIPRPQERARHGIGKNKDFVRSYKSEKQERNELELDVLLRQFKPKEPIDKAIAVKIIAFMPIPQSTGKSLKSDMEFSEKYHHMKKPDVDNLVKNLFDAMSRAGFWVDDSRVAELHVKKIYSKNPRWEVELSTLEK